MVRQPFLVRLCKGSNPFTPIKFELFVFYAFVVGKVVSFSGSNIPICCFIFYTFKVENSKAPKIISIVVGHR